METNSRKYDKLPNIVIHACKNITENMYLLKMSGPQIRLCLFTFWPIASKHLNSFTTIATLSWLTAQGSGNSSAFGARGFGFNSRFRQGFLCLYFCYVVVEFLLFAPKHIICQTFCNVNLFSIPNLLQDLWLITRVLRYRPSILNSDVRFSSKTK